MDAILLAAGEGTRANLDYPKQLLIVHDRPLFIYVLEILESVEEIEKIVVAVIPDMIEEFESLLSKYNIKKAICINGGKTRQESVYNALKSCRSEKVLIHVASRPYITREHIKELISYDSHVVVPYVPFIYASVDKDFNYLDRNNIFCIQLPQVFSTKILKNAHELGKGKNYTEDSELVYKEMGISPLLIRGLDKNTKITFPYDIEMAKIILNNNLKL